MSSQKTFSRVFFRFRIESPHFLTNSTTVGWHGRRIPNIPPHHNNVYVYVYLRQRRRGRVHKLSSSFFSIFLRGEKRKIYRVSLLFPPSLPSFRSTIPCERQRKASSFPRKRNSFASKVAGKRQAETEREGPTFPSSSIVWSWWQDGIRNQCCAVLADTDRKMTECTEDRTLFLYLLFHENKREKPLVSILLWYFW